MMTLRRAVELLESKHWTFAKTMPRNPHFWSVRKDWHAEEEWFSDVVAFILRHGQDEIFGKTRYRVLHANGWKYWNMNETPDGTNLINRCRSYKQAQPYDGLASVYDPMFSAREFAQENQELVAMLGHLGGNVLDVGCGTGLLLDLVPVEHYVGIDPSEAMLRELARKHPDRCAIQTTFEHYVTGAKFHHVVGLFGAPSYVHPTAWARLAAMLQPDARVFLMFYRPGYTPLTHVAMRERGQIPPEIASARDGETFGHYTICREIPS